MRYVAARVVTDKTHRQTDTQNYPNPTAHAPRVRFLHIYICWLLPSNRSLYKQIAGQGFIQMGGAPAPPSPRLAFPP